jgi:hypothetical protein
MSLTVSITSLFTGEKTVELSAVTSLSGDTIASQVVPKPPFDLFLKLNQGTYNPVPGVTITCC